MYEPRNQKSSVSLAVVESAFVDINNSSIELTQKLGEFNSSSTKVDASEIMTKASLLIGYMISVRNQLLIYKKEGLSANSIAKEYLTELKIQMDGLKTILYAYGNIFSSIGEQENLNNQMK